MRKKLTVILALVALVCTLAACNMLGDVYVTFDAQNGTAPTVVKFDSNFTLPAAPTKEGYEFGGWYLDKDCTNPWEVSATQSITVYAKWIADADAVFVYFDAQNGAAPVAVKFDENFALPQTPTNGNKVFGGWYLDSECTTPWQKPQTLAESVTVYAKWDEPSTNETYVYFDAQNGTEPVAVKFDENFALPQTPTNGNKVFGGWFTDTSFDNEWSVPSALTQSVTVYAKWFDVADLSDVFANYDDYSKWNFQIHYTLTEDSNGFAYYDQQQKLFGDDVSITYVDQTGVTRTDFFVYDEAADLFSYYYDNADGSYSVFTENDDAFMGYYYNVGIVELTTLGDLLFCEEDGCYVAIDPQVAGDEIFGEWEECLWYEVKLFVTDGKISKITAIQLDTSAYSTGSYTFTAEFSEYGNSQFDLPDVTVENDAELVQIFNKYTDDSAWNFKAAYNIFDGAELYYSSELSYLGWNVKYCYEDFGNNYVDYVVFEADTGRMAYYSEMGDGTYEVYYADDEETGYLFDYYYGYMDYVDLTSLNRLQFLAQGDHFAAQYPQSAGMLVLGDMGISYTSFELFVADGEITKIVATLEPFADEEDASVTYNYTIVVELSDHGAVSFTFPEISGGGADNPDSGETGDASKSVFTDGNLSTANAASVQFSSSRVGDGFDDDYGRGVQFSQASGAVTITSETSVSGVTQITLNLATNADAGFTVSVKVGSVSLTCGGTANYKVGKTGTDTVDVTFTSDTALDGVITIVLTPAQSKKSMYIASVAVNGANSGESGGESGGNQGGDQGGNANVMPSQPYDETTFDNDNLQDKLFQYEEQEYGNGAIGLPSTGEYSALVVPIQFGTTAITSDALNKLNVAFNGTSEQTGWESVNSYYQKSSFGNLNVTFDIWNFNVGVGQGNFIAANSARYYANLQNQNASDVLLKEVLTYLENKIDLGKYDVNADGFIDAVYLIYDYDVNYDSDDSIWWAYTTWYTGEETYDNLYAYYYFFAGFDFMVEDVVGGKVVSSVVDGLIVNAATYIHETGHLLGLDDYYDYEEGLGSDLGLGGADMMDYTVGDHNVYSKIMLGWLQPTVITQTQTFTIDLSNSDTSDNCVMLLLNGNNSYFCEYLLIDLYSATGLNQLHASQSNSILYEGAQFGARIYHVSSEVTNPYGDSYQSFTDNNNSVSAIPLLKLVEADGDECKTQFGAWASESDLWQTGDVFANYTRNDGKTINFSVSFDAVTATTATITVTFVAAA